VTKAQSGGGEEQKGGDEAEGDGESPRITSFVQFEVVDCLNPSSDWVQLAKLIPLRLLISCNPLRIAAVTLLFLSSSTHDTV
jgi:hypothetical protein